MNITNSYIEKMKAKETPFSKALKHFLDEDDSITQTKLAEKIGISQSYISGLKTGDKEGSEKIRTKIAEYFGKTYFEFIDFGRVLQGKKPTTFIFETDKIISALQKGLEKATVYQQASICGEETPKSDLKAHIKKKNQAHHDIVDKFKNADLAEKINHKLLEIEPLDPEYFEEIYTILQARLDRLKKKKEDGNQPKGEEQKKA